MKHDYGKHALEPVWLGCRRLRRSALPEHWRDWLLDPSSLTRRLQRRCGPDFHVAVLSQRMERPMLSEARALHRPPQEVALVRQVRLLCDETSWVFARTIIPLPSLKRGLQRLAQLGDKPLGAVLFADPKMQRQPMEVARIKPGQRLYHMSHGSEVPSNKSLWGRRSVFCLQGSPLLVSEFFLPELLWEDKVK